MKQMEEYLESLRQRERAAGRDSERRAGERDPPPVSRKRSRWGGGHGGRNEPKRLKLETTHKMHVTYSHHLGIMSVISCQKKNFGDSIKEERQALMSTKRLIHRT